MNDKLLNLQSIVSKSIDFENIASKNWLDVYTLASQQGITAIVWDDIQQAILTDKLTPEQQPSKALKLQWALAVEQIEHKYARQKKVIVKLAKFFAGHNIKMMILKGYGLSLNYPIPNHRHCSDIDIWLYEEIKNSDGTTLRQSAQQKADSLLRKHFNINIDEDKHHHTVFYIDGIMVENHYDFLNIHAHHSNRLIEAKLQKLTQQEMECIDVDGAKVFIPSPDFHALFILRHSAAHFAAEKIVIRHLLDWRYFIEKYSHKIDWNSLNSIAQQTNMHHFLNCINAICIDKLELPSSLLPAFERNPKLEERVWNEIMHPEFSESKPKNVGYLASWRYMIRRWWANRWKHQIVYNESLVKTFFVQVYSHILKPKSLKL